MRQLNFNVIPTQTASTINSSAVNSVNLFYISAQIVATGAASGTLQIQASNDDSNAPNFVPSNWSNIPGASVSVTGPGAFLIPKVELSYQYVRVVYTNAGAGTISINLKALGN